jgi:hypothetical protein
VQGERQGGDKEGREDEEKREHVCMRTYGTVRNAGK